jgi:quinol monooxygenase YgiN
VVFTRPSFIAKDGAYGHSELISQKGVPGCFSFAVVQDPIDADAIWVTEVWESQGSHQASLSLPSVQQAISRGRPLIVGFGERFETQPVGGHGLVQ